MEVKNIGDLPDLGTTPKTSNEEDRLTLEKNFDLPLRYGQTILREKDLSISCETITRSLLAKNTKFRSTIKKHVEKRLG